MKDYKRLISPLIFFMVFSFYWVAVFGVSVRRVLVVLTLGTILWSIYNLLKEPVLSGKVMIIVMLVAITSLLFVIITVSKTGW